jgi:hypothetical protein
LQKYIKSFIQQPVKPLYDIFSFFDMLYSYCYLKKNSNAKPKNGMAAASKMVAKKFLFSTQYLQKLLFFYLPYCEKLFVFKSTWKKIEHSSSRVL